VRSVISRLTLGIALALVFGSVAAAQPLTCQVTTGAVTPTLRAEGLTERVGDIAIICAGGTPTASGSQLPQATITVFLNTAVTSRTMDATGASEAILMVDEPGSLEPGAPLTQLACATPLTGCSIVSNGGEPYDGTAGHPNIYEGVVSGNTVTFYGVPLGAPGNFGIAAGGPGVRVLRVMNIRVDAAAFPSALVSSATPPTVQAAVSLQSSSPIPLTSNVSTVGYVEYGLNYQTWNASNTAVIGSANLAGCVPLVPCEVAIAGFTENFSTALLARIAGGVTQQNIPGNIYYSESGFFNTALASSNPNFATLGLADAGTRLKATFQGVPAGAQIWVGDGSDYTFDGVGQPAALTANESGALNPVTATSTIAGRPVAQLAVTNGSATAVWEVTFAVSVGIQTFSFPVWVVFPSGSSPAGTLTIQGTYAPNADAGAFPYAGEGEAQTAAYPEPRFTSGPLAINVSSNAVTLSASNPTSVTVTSSSAPTQMVFTANVSALTDNFLCVNGTNASTSPTLSGLATPANLSLTVCGNPSVSVTTHTATITLNASDGFGSFSAVINVTYTVGSGGAGGAGTVTAAPSSIIETVAYGGSTTTLIILTTSSTTPISFTLASPPVSWLSWYQTGGDSGLVSAAQSAAITVVLNGAAYFQTAQPTVLMVNLPSSTLGIPVTLYNGGIAPFGTTGTLSVNPSAVTWSYATPTPEITPTPIALTLSSTNGAISYFASASSSNGWLLVNNALSAEGTVGSTPLSISANTNLATLSPGTYEGSVFVTGSDGSTAVVTVTATVMVLPLTIVSLTSSINPSALGQTVIVNAALTPPTGTGFVTFYEGTSVLGTSPVSSGTASIETILLPAGRGTLKAFYSGDSSHGAGTSNLIAQSVNANVGGGLAIGQALSLGNSATSIAVADFNGDGKADLAVGTQGGAVNVFLGNGLGTFQSAGTYAFGAVWAVASGDFNGDGKADLVAASISNNSVGLLLGNGDGTFQQPIGIAVNFSPTSVVVADFNGDGKADLAIGGLGSELSIMLGNGDGTFQAAVNYAMPQPQFLAVGDFNHDGNADLAVATSSGVAIMLGNGDGTLQTPVDYPDNATAIAVGDFNGDGKPDLALAYALSTTSSVSILLGNGDGTFQTAASIPAGGPPDCLTIADFNGDGKPDLAAGVGSGGLSVLLGNGNGSFQPAITYYVGEPVSMVSADLNGDGKADLALASSDAPMMSVLLGALRPTLSVTSTHNGNFTQGQTGAYTLNVSNQAGSGVTVGPVIVTEAVPTGLSLTSLAGSGWTCSGNSCNRSDSLAGGASYPAITATVNVANGAPPQGINQVSVSGGGSASASANDATTIAGLPPSPSAVGPAAGSGTTQTFTFTFTDPAGYADLAVMDILINNYLDGQQACYIALALPTASSGYLYLVDDAGDGGYASGSPMYQPSSNSLRNSQCTISGAGSSVSASGNTLTLTLAIAFAPGFGGNKIFYTAARSNPQNSGWQAMGTWNVPGAQPTGPAIGGVSPGRSTASAGTYTFTFTDTYGYADLAVLDILTDSYLDGVGACYVAYVPTSATTGYLYLVDDAGDGGYASGSPALLSSGGTLHNSQCRISTAGSSASASGNTLTLNLAITFSPSFAGNQIFYVAARNNGAGNSGWQAVGSVTVN
jgi:hypothetical protein